MRILRSGLLATVQDLGRYGYQDQGVRTGGPMDEHAFLWANHLLRNDHNAAQIEITFGSFECVFTKPTMIALCGAQCQLRIDGQIVPMWHSYAIVAGTRLEISYTQTGVRVYLAIAGGFDAQVTAGSMATVPGQQIGSVVSADDEIEFAAQVNCMTRAVPSQFIPRFEQEVQLACVPAYQYHDFSDAERHAFFNSRFQVSKENDRMAYRLTGSDIQAPNKAYASEGIALGAVQIPADGQPIILCADHQSIGGYAKIVCIARVDLSILAQCRTGDCISFYETTVEEATQKLQQRIMFFR
ncbi:MAG: biotin-dependent carboxyltransferase family protein [Planctomycetes bacterium]|nr:biotin-dependent carboxyltransferase family protein [Planctomycetota bacterium]